METEVKRLVIEVARLADLSPDEISADARLFEDLGLDSLDLLQIAGALSKRYRITLASGAHLAAELGSVRKIADLVGAARAPGGPR